MLQLSTNNEIIINGKDTGLGLSQTAKGTIVYTREVSFRRQGIVNNEVVWLEPVPYKEHPMPHPRYSAAHDAPASGAAGRSQLEADVLALLARLRGGEAEK